MQHVPIPGTEEVRHREEIPCGFSSIRNTIRDTIRIRDTKLAAQSGSKHSGLVRNFIHPHTIERLCVRVARSHPGSNA